MNREIKMIDRNERLEVEVALQKQKLDWMLQLSQSINLNFSRKTLLDSFGYILKDGFGIEEFALYILEDQWTCTKQGSCANNMPEQPHHGFSDYPGIDELSKEDAARFCEMKYIIPILHKSEPLAYLLLSKNQWEGHTVLANLEFIQALTNIVAIGFENKRLFKNTMQQELIKHDLELARKIQESLVQDELPDKEFLRFSSIYIPDRAVGGDYFDCEQLSETEWFFCVADVSGKGIAASLLMANFQANLRALIGVNSDLETLIPELNKSFYHHTKGDGYITLFLGIINVESGKLRYVNCGHVPPILCSGKDMKRLENGTTIIGAFDELPFLEVNEIALEKESIIINFTDGVSEIKNFEEEDYTEERLVQFTCENFNESIEDFNNKLIQELRQFRGSEYFSDDVTILSLRYRPEKFISS